MSQDTSRRTGEAKFRKILENIPTGVLALDRDWQILYLNHRAEQMLHQKREKLLGKNLWQAFPESVNNRFYRAYHEAILRQECLTVEDYSQVLGKWTQATVYPSTDGVSVYFQDLTGQRLAEKEAWISQNNYRLLLDRITDGFIALDQNFCYTYVNQRIGELVRRKPKELLGKNVWDEFPEAIGSYTYRAFLTAMKEQRFISNTDYYAPLDLWQENYIYPSPEGLSVFVKDITEQKKLERELKLQEENQQQLLLAATLQAQEKERAYIGRELHDNVGQLLTAAKLVFETVKERPAAARDLLRKGISYLVKAVDENRKLAHAFVAPPFVAQDFGKAIYLLLQSMLEAQGITVVFDDTDYGVTKISKDVQLALYRIVQEQCTNIVKHSAAQEVSVWLRRTPAGIELEVQDNGKGRDEVVSKGIGLRNMEARLAVFKGSLVVRSGKGEGFSLLAMIPNEGLA